MRRNYVAKQDIDIRFEAPASLNGGLCESGVIGQHHAKFAQRFVLLTLNEVKVRGFPRDVGSGRVGLDCIFQGGSLFGDVAKNLMGAGEIEPEAGRVRVELDGGGILRDCLNRIVSNQTVIAAKMIAVFGVAGIEPRCAFETLHFGARVEPRCYEQASSEADVEDRQDRGNCDY